MWRLQPLQTPLLRGLLASHRHGPALEGALCLAWCQEPFLNGPWGAAALVCTTGTSCPNGQLVTTNDETSDS